MVMKVCFMFVVFFVLVFMKGILILLVKVLECIKIYIRKVKMSIKFERERGRVSFVCIFVVLYGMVLFLVRLYLFLIRSLFILLLV